MLAGSNSRQPFIWPLFLSPHNQQTSLWGKDHPKNTGQMCYPSKIRW